jgi:hypothetical protein
VIRGIPPEEVVLQVVENWSQRPYESLLVARIPDELDKVSLPQAEGIVRRVNGSSPAIVGPSRYLRAEATRVSFLKPSHVIAMDPALVAAVGASIAAGTPPIATFSGTDSPQLPSPLPAGGSPRISGSPAPSVAGGDSAISAPTSISASSAATAAALITGANGDLLTIDFAKVTLVRPVEGSSYEDAPYIRERSFDIVLPEETVTLLAESPGVC